MPFVNGAGGPDERAPLDIKVVEQVDDVVAERERLGRQRRLTEAAEIRSDDPVRRLQGCRLRVPHPSVTVA